MTQEGTTLLIGERETATSVLAVNAVRRLEDPNEGEDGKGEGGPMNEGRALVIKNGPQCPGDDESARKVTVNGGERVGGCGSLQEEEGEEYEDLSPDPSVMLSRIDTECLEGGQQDNDGGPPMPHGEWQMHKQLIAYGLGGMILLDGVVDTGDGRGNEEGEDKSDDKMVIGPDGDEDRVEDGKEREPPGDAVDHDELGVGGGELIDDGAKKEEVDDRPSEEGPVSGGEVRLLDVSIDRMRGGYGVDV